MSIESPAAREQVSVSIPLGVAESDWNARYERLIAYYEQAGPDYEEWSRAFNMHFGYFRAGLNPFLREPMLHEMNRQALERLRLNPDSDGLLVDLGCGVGATVRFAASMFPRARIL